MSTRPSVKKSPCVFGWASILVRLSGPNHSKEIAFTRSTISDRGSIPTALRWPSSSSSLLSPRFRHLLLAATSSSLRRELLISESAYFYHQPSSVQAAAPIGAAPDGLTDIRSSYDAVSRFLVDSTWSQ